LTAPACLLAAAPTWTMFGKHDYTNDGAVSEKDDVEPADKAT
jgi:hypothetical protein